MELIKEGTRFIDDDSNSSYIHPRYRIRKNGKFIDIYCIKGCWIADKNYILYENVLYPIVIDTNTKIIIE